MIAVPFGAAERRIMKSYKVTDTKKNSLLGTQLPPGSVRAICGMDAHQKIGAYIDEPKKYKNYLIEQLPEEEVVVETDEQIERYKKAMRKTGASASSVNMTAEMFTEWEEITKRFKRCK